MNPDLLSQYLDVCRKGGAAVVQLKTPEGVELMLQMAPDTLAMKPRSPEELERHLRGEVDESVLYGSSGK